MRNDIICTCPEWTEMPCLNPNEEDLDCENYYWGKETE